MDRPWSGDLQGSPVEGGQERAFPGQKVQLACCRGHEAAEDLGDRAAGFGSRKPSGAVWSVPVFLVHTRGPKKWRLLINLRRHNAMLEDGTKALASQPRWHGEADGSSPLIRVQAYHLVLLRVESLILAQAYHLLLMLDLANGWMAFKVHGQWYRYRVLSFSLKCSPWIFPKLTGLLLWHWRSLGGMVAAYKPFGRTMTKASLVGTLGGQSC